MFSTGELEVVDRIEDQLELASLGAQNDVVAQRRVVAKRIVDGHADHQHGHDHGHAQAHRHAG